MSSKPPTSNGSAPRCRADERADFGYDARSLDWWDYWINVHIPALRKWCYPLIEGRQPEARPRRTVPLATRSDADAASAGARVRQRHPDTQITVAILLTGSTGYIGAHIASNLLADHSDPLNLLVRARDAQEAQERLWRSLQLHLDFARFEEFLHSRIRIFRGDLTDRAFRPAPTTITRNWYAPPIR